MRMVCPLCGHSISELAYKMASSKEWVKCKCKKSKVSEFINKPVTERQKCLNQTTSDS